MDVIYLTLFLSTSPVQTPSPITEPCHREVLIPFNAQSIISLQNSAVLTFEHGLRLKGSVRLNVVE